SDCCQYERGPRVPSRRSAPPSRTQGCSSRPTASTLGTSILGPLPFLNRRMQRNPCMGIHARTQPCERAETCHYLAGLRSSILRCRTARNGNVFALSIFPPGQGRSPIDTLRTITPLG